MVQKLKLLFQGQPSASILKAIIFTGLLWLLKTGGFSFWSILIFGVGVLFLYRPRGLTGSGRIIPFLALTILSALILFKLGGVISSLPLILISGLLFYILLGLQRMFLVSREKWSYLMHLVFLYAVSILFFIADRSSFFWWKALLTFGVLFVILYGFFGLLRGLNQSKDNFKAKPAYFAAILALIIFESFWAASFLPLTILSFANLSLLISFIAINLTVTWFKDGLTSRAILSHLSLFVIFLILIFITVNWSV